MQVINPWKDDTKWLEVVLFMNNGNLMENAFLKITSNFLYSSHNSIHYTNHVQHNWVKTALTSHFFHNRLWKKYDVLDNWKIIDCIQCSGGHISWHGLFLAGNQGNHQNFDPSLLRTAWQSYKLSHFDALCTNLLY